MFSRAIRVSFLWACCCGLAYGDIKNWQTGESIPGTEGISLEPGVQLMNWNTEERNLRFADLGETDVGHSIFWNSWLDDARFTGADLSNAFLGESTLTRADFERANLTDVYLGDSTLTHANLAGAIVRGAIFDNTTSHGFTKEQLYSTVSYQNGTLQEIGLRNNDLSSWNCGILAVRI